MTADRSGAMQSNDQKYIDMFREHPDAMAGALSRMEHFLGVEHGPSATAREVFILVDEDVETGQIVAAFSTYEKAKAGMPYPCKIERVPVD